jgi:hypothetical protein
VEFDAELGWTFPNLRDQLRRKLEDTNAENTVRSIHLFVF